MRPVQTMKRALCVLLVLLSMAMPTALAANSSSYYVNTGTVNVRTGPSSSYSSKKKLHKGDVVSYKNAKNGWYYVTYTGGAGWIYRKYLTKVSSSSSSSVSTGKYKTTGQMNLRSKASLNSSVIGTVKKGAKVTVKKTSHG